METCEYEQLRRKNLEDNKRILAELGLSNPYRLLPKVIKKGIKRPGDDETYQPRKKKARVQSAVDLENSGSIWGPRRLSARLRGQLPGTECIGEDDHLEREHEQQRVKYQYVMPDRPNWYGEVPGVEVGTIWMMRIDCCRDGIHRPTVAGIHGGPEGAYSIALSGGYEDDVDLGDCFTYTGEGGRDLKGTRNNPKNLRTAPQSKNQELTRGNLALSRSVETGQPVRVIRGYKLRSPFAPDEGYRYDGLYTVEKFWFTKGLSGFEVYKFALRRCKDQALPPWELLASEPLSPSKSSDSGFSDSATCDGESVSGQKNETADSEVNTDSPGKADDDDSADAKSDLDESEKMDDKSDAKSNCDDSEKMDDKSVAKSNIGDSEKMDDKSDAKSDVGDSEKMDDKSVAKSNIGDSEKMDDKSDAKSDCDDSEKMDDKSDAKSDCDDSEKMDDKSDAKSNIGDSEKTDDKTSDAKGDVGESDRNSVASGSVDARNDRASEDD